MKGIWIPLGCAVASTIASFFAKELVKHMFRKACYGKS